MNIENPGLKGVIVPIKYRDEVTGALVSGAETVRKVFPRLNLEVPAAIGRIQAHSEPYVEYTRSSNVQLLEREVPESTFELNAFDTSLAITGLRFQAESYQKTYLNSNDPTRYQQLKDRLCNIARLSAVVLLRQRISDEDIATLLNPDATQIEASIRKVPVGDAVNIAIARPRIELLNKLAACMEYGLVKSEDARQPLPDSVLGWRPEN